LRRILNVCASDFLRALRLSVLKELVKLLRPDNPKEYPASVK
jgi:hypothetical protein